MKNFAIILGVLFCVSCAFAQPPDGPGMGKITPALPEPIPELGPVRDAVNRLNNPLEKVDLSSPENAVRSFVWAMNNADIAAASQCVFNAKSIDELLPLGNDWKKGYKSYVFLVQDLHAYIDEENATVVLRLNFLSSSPQPKSYGSCERLHLIKTGETWHIVAEPETNVPPLPGRRAFVEDLMAHMLAALVKTPDLTVEETFNGCRLSMEQIGLAFFQYAQDFNEKFPSIENWQSEIMPYLKDEKLLNCPAAKPNETSYSYNPEFFGAILAVVQAPAQTILLYEGKDKKFEFRHELNGVKLTNILFADGHVKAFSEKTLEAALKDESVRWRP